MIRAIILLALYAFGLTWWALGEPKRSTVRVENAMAKLQGRFAKQLLQAQELQAEVHDEGEQARVEVQKVFVPIKEQVREIVTVYSCDGEYDDGVRNALKTAVNAANAAGGLPAAGN